MLFVRVALPRHVAVCSVHPSATLRPVTAAVGSLRFYSASSSPRPLLSSLSAPIAPVLLRSASTPSHTTTAAARVAQSKRMPSCSPALALQVPCDSLFRLVLGCDSASRATILRRSFVVKAVRVRTGRMRANVTSLGELFHPYSPPESS